jgi:hypothetical protein
MSRIDSFERAMGVGGPAAAVSEQQIAFGTRRSTFQSI